MLNGMKLKGKTAMVTGGGRRLGKEIAMSLARQGADIILHYYRSEKEVTEVLKEIHGMGRQCRITRQDLSDSEQTERWFESLMKEKIPLDILVNSASDYSGNKYMDMNAGELSRSMSIHVHSPLIMMRKMRKNGYHGSIVNILDTRVADRDSIHASYHLGKRGLFTITRDLAVEFAPELRINAVAPGIILPPDGTDEHWIERLKASNPLMKRGNPEDVCEAVLFLINAEFITGQIIYVDGGRHLKGNAYGL